MNPIHLARRIRLGIGLPIAMLIALSILSYKIVIASRAGSAWVQHTYLVIDKLAGLLVAVEDVESGYRGFALVGDERFLLSHSNDLTTLRTDLAAIRTLTADNPDQARRIERLAALVDEKIQFGDLVVRVRRDQGAIAASKRVAQGDGIRFEDEIRGLVGEMRADEERLLAARQTTAARDFNWIIVALTLGVVGATIVMGLAGWMASRDTTARLRSEQAQRDERDRSQEFLDAAEDRTRFALESAGVGIWDLDHKTGALRASRTLEEHYGYDPGTFVGRIEAFTDRVHPDDRAELLETLAAARRSGGEFSVVHRVIWPDNTIHWLSNAGRFQSGTDGQPVRGVGISLDVTQRRTLEAQYQQAQKMEAIGLLAGGVAHDFNNLLTVMLGYCELLLAEFAPADQRRSDISEIQKAGTRAAGLTRQLLAFSRKEIIEPTLFDLNVIVSEMREMISRLIGEDVRITLGLAPKPSCVLADRGQIDQIIMNLAVNARDAMPAGGTLTIETANVELDERYGRAHVGVKPGPYVRLTVRDTGTGMTPEVQARLFEPFFTTKSPGKGTGLGLASVHGIAAQNGGSITVESVVGAGTTFNVFFPRDDSMQPIVVANAPAREPHGGSETVLVVDDADGLRELTRRLLERMGYNVLVAANADEAIRQFEAHPSIDVLLTDVVMPGASGPELTKQLEVRRPGLRVLYMSGFTEEAIVHHGVIDPGIAFLHKPFTSTTLGRKLREVLDRPGSFQLRRGDAAHDGAKRIETDATRVP